MRYVEAPDLQEKAEDISRVMFPHVKVDRMKCFRSFGSSSRGTIARCHALGKLMQKTIGVQAYYALEFISERFDKMPEEEQLKVIMHELMHIPKTFGGGFKHHDFVCERNVNMYCKEYKKRKTQENENENLQRVLHSSSNQGKENNEKRKDKLAFWR